MTIEETSIDGSSNQIVPLSALGMYLKAFRELYGRRRSEIVGRLKETGETIHGFGFNPATIARLEEGRLKKLFSLEDAQLLANAYSMSNTMICSVLGEVRPQNESSLVLKTTDFRSFSLKSSHHLGESSDYVFPLKRLHESDAVFVRVTMKKGGSSDVHVHPGSELILCAQGTVKVCLKNSGIKVPLAEGDLIHFQSEQWHQVHNCGQGDAELVIIRFYAFEDGGPIRKTLKELKGLRKGLVDDCATDGDALVQKLNQISNIFIEDEKPMPTTIRNPFGLVRFIEQLEPEFSILWRKVQDLARESPEVFLRGCFKNRASFNSLVKKGEISNSEDVGDVLNGLSRVLDVPQVVLATYLYPSVPNVVALKKDDFVPVPSAAGVGPKSKLVVPRRSLFGSDITMSKLILAAGESCDRNSHMGFEMIYVLKGEAIVDLFFNPTASPTSLDGSEGDIVHFRSSTEHSVRNPQTDAGTELLVVRFHNSARDA